MTLIIPLPPEDETKLAKRAAAVGKDVVGYVQELIIREIDTAPSLSEAAEPLARAVNAAGVTDEEFLEILGKARAEVRAARRVP